MWISPFGFFCFFSHTHTLRFFRTHVFSAPTLLLLLLQQTKKGTVSFLHLSSLHICHKVLTSGGGGGSSRAAAHTGRCWWDHLFPPKAQLRFHLLHTRTAKHSRRGTFLFFHCFFTNAHTRTQQEHTFARNCSLMFLFLLPGRFVFDFDCVGCFDLAEDDHQTLFSPQTLQQGAVFFFFGRVQLGEQLYFRSLPCRTRK